jgi:hypothetical protein
MYARPEFEEPELIVQRRELPGVRRPVPPGYTCSMRWFTLLFVVLILAPAYAQDVRLVAHDAPVADVFVALARQAGLDAVVPSLNGIRVTLSLRSASARDALDAVCDVTGLKAEIRGRILVVFKPKLPGR